MLIGAPFFAALTDQDLAIFGVLALANAVAVSVATVYNTLHQFTKVGLLREVVVEPGRSYFDTNVNDHHHFYFESSGQLQDIPSERLSVAELPEPPQGTRISRVDVVVRVQDADSQ